MAFRSNELRLDIAESKMRLAARLNRSAAEYLRGIPIRDGQIVANVGSEACIAHALTLIEGAIEDLTNYEQEGNQ